MQHTCLRCNHIWESRINRRPKQCPNCRQNRWDIPARIPKEKKGKKPKYAQKLHYLQPGEEVIFEWYEKLENGILVRDKIKNHNIHKSICNFIRENPYMKLIVTPISAGIRVYRKE